jgi:ABC-type polysaccharide/polyol phosphate export permease
MKLPLMLVPVVGPVRALFHIMVFWIFGAAFLIYYLFTKHHFYLQLPPQFFLGLAGLALCVAYGWSLGIPLGLIYPRAKEIKYVIRYSTSLWMFVTPVLYPLEMLHGWAHTVAQLNPLTGALELVQYGFLDAGKVHMLSILVSLIGLVLLTLFGLWVFNRYAVKLLAMPSGGRDDEEDEDEGMM